MLNSTEHEIFIDVAPIGRSLASRDGDDEAGD